MKSDLCRLGYVVESHLTFQFRATPLRRNIQAKLRNPKWSERVVGAVDNYSITFRIYGDSLDPTEITQLMGQQPDSCLVKGEQIFGDDGKFRRVARSGSWRIVVTSQDCLIKNFESAIGALLAKLTLDLDVWHSIAQRFNVELFCGIFLSDTNQGIFISAELSQLLAERHIGIGFDIYADGSS